MVLGDDGRREGGADCHDFRMCGRVVILDRPIESPADDLAVTDYYRADRHLIDGHCDFGFSQRLLHEGLFFRAPAHSHSIVAGGLPEMS